jgi:predicted transcriptional regulator
MRSEIITGRFSKKDAASIKKHAEMLNVNNAEMLRILWKEYEESNQLKQLLTELKNEITQRMFSVSCATINLNSNERMSAANQVNDELNREVVK